MSKDEAVRSIADQIRGCFGSVDLKFALHHSDEERAKQIKTLVKKYALTRDEVDRAIRPVFEQWLNTDYGGFNSNVRGPLSDDPNVVAAKVREMVNSVLNYTHR
ncbi:hypothetical protein [Azospirillum soli]|uniref:hypothetical protein n=1 Tax=Azospirillum soli TaxID=1304799 RepID=UPI001AE47EDC|nr:hypothetical protein [Azospirillum soli]MBP2315456.1 hypothetical protein [Azospirillum soli]